MTPGRFIEPRSEDETLWDQLEFLYAHQGTCAAAATCALCARWRTIKTHVMMVWREEPHHEFDIATHKTSTSTGGKA